MRINSLSFVEEQINIKKLTKVETRNFVETIDEMILTGQSRSLGRVETSCGLFPAIVLRYLIRTERKRLFSGLVCSTPF